MRSSRLKTTARTLRRKQTEAEVLLWSKLRNRQLLGFKFRRQHPIGKYIVDFYCEKKELAIELDGGQHAADRQKIYDDKRTFDLEKFGVRVLRFWDNEVFQNTEEVLEKILGKLRE